MTAIDFARRPTLRSRMGRRPAIGRTPILMVAFVTALLLALPGIVVAGF